MRPSVQGVDPPVCCTPGCYCYICKRQLCGFPQCAASWMTYARDSFVDSQGGLLSSRGGGPDTLAPVLHYCIWTSGIIRTYGQIRAARFLRRYGQSYLLIEKSRLDASNRLISRLTDKRPRAMQ